MFVYISQFTIWKYLEEFTWDKNCKKGQSTDGGFCNECESGYYTQWPNTKYCRQCDINCETNECGSNTNGNCNKCKEGYY